MTVKYISELISIFLIKIISILIGMIIDITVSNICTLHIDDKQKCVRKERKKEMAFVCFVMDSLIVFMSMLDMLEQIDILL